MASTKKNDPRGVLIVDLGAQYAQLIARRVREAGSWCEIAPPGKALEAAQRMNLAGVILSGGPASVYAPDAPKVPRELLDLGVPVLGICYGMQWMSQQLGGDVQAADEREFGRTSIAIARPEGLLEAIEGRTVVWMSHGDKVERLPAGFEVYASSDNCPFAVVGDRQRRLYGVQFHPEVSHTLRGAEILTNFLARVCELPLDWKPGGIVEREVAKIRATVGRVDRGRPAREDQAGEVHAFGGLERLRRRRDLAPAARLAHAARDQLGVLRPEVDDQDAARFVRLRAGHLNRRGSSWAIPW